MRSRERERLRARVAELAERLATVEAELAPYRLLNGRLSVQCGGCGKFKSIDLSPRAIRERLADAESDLDFAARMADLFSPQADFARAMALGEARDEAMAKAHQREKELRAEVLYDRDETRQRLAQGPPVPKG